MSILKNKLAEAVAAMANDDNKLHDKLVNEITEKVLGVAEEEMNQLKSKIQELESGASSNASGDAEQSAQINELKTALETAQQLSAQQSTTNEQQTARISELEEVIIGLLDAIKNGGDAAPKAIAVAEVAIAPIPADPAQ